MAESNASSVVLHEGYMMKSSPLKKTLITWTKRWFVMEEIKEGHDVRTELAYYRDDRKASRKGVIPLDQFDHIDTKVHRRGKKHLFGIVTHPRTFLLSVESEEQMKIWLAKLRESLAIERVVHVCPSTPDKQLKQDSLLRFRHTSLEVICPATNAILKKWNLASVRAMGTSGPMFWVDCCSKCADVGEANGLVFLGVQRGVEAAAQLLKEAQSFCTDPLVEQTNDMGYTLKLRGHMKCSSTQLRRAPSSASALAGMQTSVASSAPRRRSLTRGISSPALAGSNEYLSGIGGQNQHAVALAQTVSRLRSSTTSALTSPYVNMSLSSTTSPLIRVPYETGSCMTLPSPSRRPNSGRERTSLRSRSSNVNSWGRMSTDSGVCSYYGHQLDAFLNDGGSLPRNFRRSPQPSRRSPQPSPSAANGEEGPEYEMMVPVSEEAASSSSDSESAFSRRKMSETFRNSFRSRTRSSFRSNQGSFRPNGYVNMDVLPDPDTHSN